MKQIYIYIYMSMLVSNNKNIKYKELIKFKWFKKEK